MAQRYLIDTNAVIDFCNGKLPAQGKNLLLGNQPELSIITNIELFATQNISAGEYELLEKFVAISLVHPVTVDLIGPAILIRQTHKLKVPDAIIAATALVYNLSLITRNTADFKGINGLQVVNPHSL